MFPQDDVLFDLVVRFTSVLIFFDNDEAGKKASKKLMDLVNSKYPRKSKQFWLEVKNPDVIKDPGEFVKFHSIDKLKKLLKHFRIL